MEQTKLYAMQCLGDKYEEWEQVTYYGFTILMGVVRLPSLHEYWRCDDHFHYSPIASRISRSRFFELRYLHFADNSKLAPPGSDGYQKLGKVWPLIDAIVSKCRSLYNVHRDVSVDEAMIKFKGRSSLKQYLPKKPVKRWQIQPMATSPIFKFTLVKENCLGTRVVKDLTEPIQFK